MKKSKMADKMASDLKNILFLFSRSIYRADHIKA